MDIINEEAFLKLVKTSQKLVLVDFFATWCGPCKMISPELEEACEEAGIKCYKIDVDQSSSFARAHGVMSVPTVFAYKNGQPIDHFTGYKTKDEILEFIEENNY